MSVILKTLTVANALVSVTLMGFNYVFQSYLKVMFPIPIIPEAIVICVSQSCFAVAENNISESRGCLASHFLVTSLELDERFQVTLVTLNLCGDLIVRDISHVDQCHRFPVEVILSHCSFNFGNREHSYNVSSFCGKN